MNGQITMQQALNARFYDRNGKLKEAPEWVNQKRCGNCKHWQILPEHDQPPSGWGVKGLCGGHRSQNRNTTSQVGYCMEFEMI